MCVKRRRGRRAGADARRPFDYLGRAARPAALRPLRSLREVLSGMQLNSLDWLIVILATLGDRPSNALERVDFSACGRLRENLLPFIER